MTQPEDKKMPPEGGIFSMQLRNGIPGMGNPALAGRKRPRGFVLVEGIPYPSLAVR
mgnify:CR=1 FL=1